MHLNWATDKFNGCPITPIDELLIRDDLCCRVCIWLNRCEPIGEAIVGQGPLVLNSREEIRQAIQDYQASRMGRP